VERPVCCFSLYKQEYKCTHVVHICHWLLLQSMLTSLCRFAVSCVEDNCYSMHGATARSTWASANVLPLSNICTLEVVLRISCSCGCSYARWLFCDMYICVYVHTSCILSMAVHRCGEKLTLLRIINLNHASAFYHQVQYTYYQHLKRFRETN
jgi:hypothetical protein